MTQPRTVVDWEINGHRLPPAGSRPPSSPYLEPPTIPMTIAEYRVARWPHTTPLPLHLLPSLRQAGFGERPTGLPAAISFRVPNAASHSS